jgi:hypothetical protein
MHGRLYLGQLLAGLLLGLKPASDLLAPPSDAAGIDDQLITELAAVESNFAYLWGELVAHTTILLFEVIYRF